MKRKILTLLPVLSLLSCTQQPPIKNGSLKQDNIKNIILLIGDGMGPQQVGLLLSYAHQARKSVLNKPTAFERLLKNGGELGISLTHPKDALVTDSAAAATQISGGAYTHSERIGIDQYGHKTETVLDKAKKVGKSTGLISDTRITHATPAAFAAHQNHRGMETEIAVDLLNANVDVLFSAGLNYWLPQAINTDLQQKVALKKKYPHLPTQLRSKRTDQQNLLDDATKKGYQLVFNTLDLEQSQGKTIGLFAPYSMPDAITEHQQPNKMQPSLKMMSSKALKILDKNPNGFFLMIEAGQIDWAGHANDTGLLLHEMLKFNALLHYLLDWIEQHPGTLLVVTADHETGGFGFSYSADNVPEPRYLANDNYFKPNYNFGSPDILDKLYLQKLSYQKMFWRFDQLALDEKTPANLMKIINNNSAFKINLAQAERILLTEKNPYWLKKHSTLGNMTVPKISANSAFFPYQSGNRRNLLAQAVANQQSVAWSTGAHTSTPVYVFTKGSLSVQSRFSNIMTHRELGKKLSNVLTNINF